MDLGEVLASDIVGLAGGHAVDQAGTDKAYLGRSARSTIIPPEANDWGDPMGEDEGAKKTNGGGGGEPHEPEPPEFPEPPEHEPAEPGQPEPPGPPDSPEPPAPPDAPEPPGPPEPPQDVPWWKVALEAISHFIPGWEFVSGAEQAAEGTDAVLRHRKDQERYLNDEPDQKGGKDRR